MGCAASDDSGSLSDVPKDLIIREVEREAMRKMTNGILNGGGQRTGGGGFMNKVENTIDDMVSGEGNAPHIGRRGGRGGMLNEVADMIGDDDNNGDDGMMDEIEKAAEREFF